MLVPESAHTQSLLGQPDYPGAETEPRSSRFFGEPDSCGAENFRNSPDFWGNPDYPGAEDGHHYGSSESLEASRRYVQASHLFSLDCVIIKSIELGWYGFC